MFTLRGGDETEGGEATSVGECVARVTNGVERGGVGGVVVL